MRIQRRVVVVMLAALMLITLLSGCATKPYVLKIEDVKVRQGTFAYYYGYCYATYYESYGDQGVLYYAMSQMTQHIAVNKLFDRFGLKFTKDDEAEVDRLRAERIAEFGGQPYYTYFLRVVGLTDKLYRDILAVGVKFGKLREYLYGEGGPEYIEMQHVIDYYTSVYVHETHIFISTSKINSTAERNALLEKAQEALERARAGEDFLALIGEYGDDSFLKGDPAAGYYIARGATGEQVLEDAMFSLEIGEISDIVEAASGFFIIKRLPLDEDYFNQIFEGGTSGPAYQGYVDGLMNYYVMNETAHYNVDFLPDYKDIDFRTASVVWK